MGHGEDEVAEREHVNVKKELIALKTETTTTTTATTTTTTTTTYSSNFISFTSPLIPRPCGILPWQDIQLQEPSQILRLPRRTTPSL
jgi:hypothetical protein